MKTRLLFVCIHNSARSQMAEAFLKRHCSGRFDAHSAGIEPGSLNPVVVEVMLECGIDIARNPTKSVFDVLKDGCIFEYVITVCDESSAQRCPILPGVAKRLHWGFPDPSSLQGSPAAIRQQTRVIRDAIEQKIVQWCAVGLHSFSSHDGMNQESGGMAAADRECSPESSGPSLSTPVQSWRLRSRFAIAWA